MKVFFTIGSVRCLKVVIAASMHNIKFEIVTNAHDAINCSPLSHLVTLDDGTTFFSANAVVRYLFAGQVTDDETVDGCLELEASVLQPLVEAIVQGKSGVDDVHKLATLLNTTDCGWGRSEPHKVGAVDICLWSCLFPVFSSFSPVPALRSLCPEVSRWFDELLLNEAFCQAVGQVWQQEVQKPDKVDEEKVAVSHTISAADLLRAGEAWNQTERVKPRPRNHPILPLQGERNYLITSALPYVNNVPHLGNIIGCVLSADVFSRYCRLRNYRCLYICGTDEYGTATETKAVEEGLTPQQVCDKYHVLHRQIYQWFNIDFDYFGRTTTHQQTQIAQDIFWKLYRNDFILKDSVQQLLCVGCDRFLADRFVEGTCPLCAYPDARGDQCDACGKLINAIELVRPRCKMCGATPVVRSSDHLFMDLPKLEPMLVEYVEDQFGRGVFTSNTKVITRSWIRDGLKPRCITRDLKWGTPVPLEGYTEKVFYVWYDAPIGYISITANYTDEWEQWWKNPTQVELFNFMAKDNVPFHNVIFPCTLLGARDNWTIVNHLSATEYLNYEDGKFSKSRGVGVFGDNAMDTGIPADAWRFYLLFLRPESQDSCFSWDDFMMKNNSELLNNLGNFINRPLTFLDKQFGGVIPPMTLDSGDLELLAQVNQELASYIDNLDKIRLRDGLRNILSISRLGNLYMQNNKPWVLVKGTEKERVRGQTVIGVSCNLAALLSILLKPYLPVTSDQIRDQLQAPAVIYVLTEAFHCLLPPGHKIGTPSPLFKKIEPSLIEDCKKRFSGQQGKPASRKEPQPRVEGAALEQQLTAQGNKVRELKAAKADKSIIDEELNVLLQLKQLALAQGADVQNAPKKNKKK